MLGSGNSRNQVRAVRVRKPGSRGAALVEFAIVALLLFTLTFGIIEFGLLIRDYLAINHAAREGSRSAAVGSPVEVVLDRVQKSAPTLSVSLADIDLTTGSPATSPDSWASLGNSADGTKNDAVSGNLILVQVSYEHQMVTGGLFNDGAPISLLGKMIMRRE